MTNFPHKRRFASPTAWWFAALLVLAGCGNGDAGSGDDGAASADGIEAGETAGADTSADGDALDAGADAALADASGDVGLPDATTDADAGSDADTGGGDADDAGPDPCPLPPFPPAADPSPPPKPDESGCTWPAPKFFSEAPPAETLKPVLGVRSLQTDAWSELAQDAWHAMHVGPQGSFHVFAAYRVTVPGESGTYAKMQVETWLSDGCTLIAKGNKPVSFDYPVADQAGVFGNSEKGEIGILVEFGNPASQVASFCGRWARLHVRVKHMATGAWGSTSRMVRLYDAGKK